MECPKCKSTDVYLQKVGPHTGIYCGKCGHYIKWASADDVRLILHKQEETFKSAEV